MRRIFNRYSALIVLAFFIEGFGDAFGDGSRGEQWTDFICAALIVIALVWAHKRESKIGNSALRSKSRETLSVDKDPEVQRRWYS